MQATQSLDEMAYEVFVQYNKLIVDDEAAQYQMITVELHSLETSLNTIGK
jgi:hypothetical protein